MGTSTSRYKVQQSPKWGKDAEAEVRVIRSLLNAADTSGDGVLDLKEITVRVTQSHRWHVCRRPQDARRSLRWCDHCGRPRCVQHPDMQYDCVVSGRVGVATVVSVT